jgi:hypothetical protein
MFRGDAPFYVHLPIKSCNKYKYKYLYQYSRTGYKYCKQLMCYLVIGYIDVGKVRKNITLSTKLFGGKYKIIVSTSNLYFFMQIRVRDVKILY